MIFTPENEPYLGRESVYKYDLVIIACLKANEKAADAARERDLSELQRAACQVIPQGINIALSIRELVRQGYLFGASVLMRSLIERAAIISYLCDHPESVDVWHRGWSYKERPSLQTMLESMDSEETAEAAKSVKDMFNHIVHGDPLGCVVNLVKLGDGSLAYSVSKNLNDPSLCDEICFQALRYLAMVLSGMSQCFPDVEIEDPFSPKDS